MKVDYLARHDTFPFEVDTDVWPGRELLWCWCHPIVTAVLIADTIVVAVLAVIDT